MASPQIPPSRLIFDATIYPALQTLSKSVEPLFEVNIASVLLVLFLSPSFIQLPWGTDFFGQPAAALLFLHLTITYLGAQSEKGKETESDDDSEEEENEDGTQSQAAGLLPALQSLLEEPFAAIKVLSKPLGSYFRVGFYVALAWNSPLRAELSLGFQPWMYCALLLFGVFFGILAPTAKFYGPLRFGYLQYTEDLTRTYTILLKWWIYTTYAPSFYPIVFTFYTVGLVCVTVHNSFKIYRSYRDRVQKITDLAAEAVSTATAAKAHGRDLANVARQYETQMLSVLAVARRDALYAKKVRVTDFFDTRARAWSAVDTVKKPIENVIEAASNVLDAAMGVDETEKPDDAMGRYLVEQANIALKAAKNADSELADAQKAVSMSKNAIDDDEKARTAASNDVTNAAAIVTTLKTKLAEVETALFKISENMEKTKRQAEKAVVTVTEGEMDTADTAAKSAKDAAAMATTEKNNLSLKMQEVRSALSGFLQNVNFG